MQSESEINLPEVLTDTPSDLFIQLIEQQSQKLPTKQQLPQQSQKLPTKQQLPQQSQKLPTKQQNNTKILQTIINLEKEIKILKESIIEQQPPAKNTQPSIISLKKYMYKKKI